MCINKVDVTLNWVKVNAQRKAKHRKMGKMCFVCRWKTCSDGEKFLNCLKSGNVLNSNNVTSLFLLYPIHQGHSTNLFIYKSVTQRMLPDET